MTVEITSKVTNFDDVTMMNGTIKNQHIAMSVYSFIEDGVVIDTGSSSMEKVFKAFYAEHDFDQIVLTHFHEDHTGNAALLQKEYNKPISIHQMSTHLTKQQVRIPLYRKAIWGDVTPFDSTPLPLTFSSKQFEWEVIATPGHSKDHVAFYNKSTGNLYSGDLFVSPKVKLVLIDENVLDTLDSLKKIQKYDMNALFCCHAGHVKKPEKMIQLKIDYLEDVQGKVLALAKKGMDVYEITNELFPNDYPIINASNSEWSAVHMIRAFLNHG